MRILISLMCGGMLIVLSSCNRQDVSDQKQKDKLAADYRVDTAEDDTAEQDDRAIDSDVSHDKSHDKSYRVKTSTNIRTSNFGRKHDHHKSDRHHSHRHPHHKDKKTPSHGKHGNHTDQHHRHHRDQHEQPVHHVRGHDTGNTDTENTDDWETEHERVQDREEDDGSPYEVSDDQEGLSASEIFRRRILPIARSTEASSCTECHFGGVDLQSYVREDEATTFAALRDDDLIDLATPDKSRLLTFIARRPDEEDPLLANVRQAEYQAFRAWIHAAVADPELLATEPAESGVGTEIPLEVIRHMRRDRVLNSFVKNIWSEMGRCINCHSPERNQQVVEENGDQVSWLVPRDPAATLKELLDGGNIDIDDPENSLVLLKPTGLEDHGGGEKFAVGSRTDKNFRRFLNDYAAVIKGEYQHPDQLPELQADVTVPTDQYLRINKLPMELDGKLLKIDIYRRLSSGWSDGPWATAENPIHGDHNFWQSMLFLTAPRGSRRAEEFEHAEEIQLPTGRYLVKIYIDQEDKTKDDRDYELSDDEYYGEVQIRGRWRTGHEQKKVVGAPRPD